MSETRRIMGLQRRHAGHGATGGGPWVKQNMHIARTYWYIIAAIVGFCFVLRIIHFYDTRNRLRLARNRSVQYPSRPQNAFMQAYATGSSILREIAGPETYIKNRYVTWLSPPSLGRSAIVLIYWAVIIYMLCWDSILPKTNGYYFEKIAFRAAWVSITQVPFVYLLASKSSIIGFLAGVSHERLNWLHRWVSRTLLVSATVHGWFFYAQWDRADFVQDELEMMPMVKYGLGAWALLMWTLLSSLAPIRSWSYEIFVLQHLAAAAVLLWLLFMHVPPYAMYNVWFAVAAICADKAIFWGWMTWCNVCTPKSTGGQVIGHKASIKNLNEDMTEVIIRGVKFKWAAGQHIYLRIPVLSAKALRPLESHPFTIANAYEGTTNNAVQLIIEKKGGFTRSLHRAAAAGYTDFTAIISPPLGSHPDWATFETVVLVSASTGITFTLPVLESIVNTESPSCVKRVDFLQVVRKKHSTSCYIKRLEAAISQGAAKGIEMTVRIAVTCETCGCCGSNCQCHNFDNAPAPRITQGIEEKSSNITAPDIISSAPLEQSRSNSSETTSMEKVALADEIKIAAHSIPSQSSSGSSTPNEPLMGRRQVLWTSARPDVADFIRRPVEASGGETQIAVCGGKSLVACVRNCAVKLSDERAVHKGTGAQGIAVFTESYCF